MAANMKKLNLLSLAVVVALTGCSDDDKDYKTLVVNNTLPVGSEQCVNGGTEKLEGEDTNRNGELDADEVLTTTVTCNDPASSLTPQQLVNLSTNQWFKDAKVKMATSQDNIEKIVKESGKAKNIILFVGDGMGVSTVTAARILAGQLEGKMGEEHLLSFDTMPFSGFSKTYNVDAQTPDSAGTMTAMASGVKTDVGVIGVMKTSCVATVQRLLAMSWLLRLNLLKLMVQQQVLYRQRVLPMQHLQRHMQNLQTVTGKMFQICLKMP